MLTIVTPTYNRKNLLPRLYESIKRQTNKNFEWIIVDDGSSDGTGDLVASWLDLEHDFNIYYFVKKNGGKHTALNYAHPYIHGEIVLIADSDDWLVDEAVDNIIHDWNGYREDNSICGISYLRGMDLQHSLNDRYYPKDREISDFISIKVNDSNDCGSCEVVRTNVLKEFPFPEYEGERFVGESYLWFKAGYKYRTVYINKILYITEFYEDGLTKGGRKIRLQSPHGGMDVANLALNKRVNIKFRSRQAILYICYGKYMNLSFDEIVRRSNDKRLVVILYAFGSMLYRYWRKMYSEIG